MTHSMVSPIQTKQHSENGVVVVDIREQAEFDREHIEGAVSLPLTAIKAGQTLPVASATPVIFHCQAGTRTRQNVELLCALTRSEEMMLMAGGIDAWKMAGLPTVINKAQPLPLMRQVQIVVGSLSLAGVVAGYTISPRFFLLSGMISAGLLFAGISGWCGMATLLAKMPWNKR